MKYWKYFGFFKPKQECQKLCATCLMHRKQDIFKDKLGRVSTLVAQLWWKQHGVGMINVLWTQLQMVLHLWWMQYRVRQMYSLVSRTCMDGDIHTEYSLRYLYPGHYTGTNPGVWQMNIPHVYKISIFGAKLWKFMQLTKFKIKWCHQYIFNVLSVELVLDCCNAMPFIPLGAVHLTIHVHN